MTNWCESCLYEEYDGAEEPCIDCVRDTEVEGNAKPTEYFPKRPPKPITNAARIRSMTDEELAECMAFKIATCYGCESTDGVYCKECWLEWLKGEKIDD